MSRSSKKGPFISSKLLKKVEVLNQSGQKAVIKTWSRASTILPEMIGHTIDTEQVLVTIADNACDVFEELVLKCGL